jgi:hypothetical protein
MTRLKSDEILSEWLAVADRARQPHQAPRPATTRMRLPIGMAALAAVVVIVAVVGSRVVAPAVGPGGSPSASPSASPTTPVAQPSATTPPISIPSAEPSPTPGASPVTLTTPVVTSSWQGFTWNTLPADSPFVTADFGTQVLAWRAGYVAYGTTNGAANGFVWTSADGLTWRQVTDISAPRILVAVSPTGLVAFADDPSATSPIETVWTSTDGVAWHNAGSPGGVAFVDSIAGTSAGLVATASSGVVYSNDGITWTPLSGGPAASWNENPLHLQSGNGRFFLIGGAPGLTNGRASPAGVAWWSDNGRTWTKSGGTVPYPGSDMYFGRDGILLNWQMAAIPGGNGLARSTDGGKSWHNDPANSPLGAYVCGQHACSSGPDGSIASNGTVMVALKTNGKAWVSYDGNTWTSIGWGAPASNQGPLLVLPRGVLVGNQYGAAR